MSEQDFELYLTLLAKTLRLSDRQRGAIASELRDHLEARLDELTAQGYDKQEAIQTALAEFGDASALANDFTSIGKHRNRRRIMQTAFGTIATAAVVGFAAMTLTPTNYQGHPTQPNAGAQDGAASADDGPAALGGSGTGAAPQAETPGGRGLGGPAATGGGRGGVRSGGMAPAAGLGRGAAAPPGRELAIQAVVRDVPELADLSIHVVDCTAILSPRADGLDLLARTEALASAVEETVGAIRPHGPSEIQVRAFEEFLIITATEDAYAQAQSLLENISSHVERRDAIQRQQDAFETQDAVNRIQQALDQTQADLARAAAELDAVNAARFEADPAESDQLQRRSNELSDQIDMLRAKRQELELRRAELLPFGGC